MIRATPNSVRWDEVNKVKYKFQAFNLPADLLENLILSSPPLVRRGRASSSPEHNHEGHEAEAPGRARLCNDLKSSSLDDSQLSTLAKCCGPRRKLSVVDAPSLKDCVCNSMQSWNSADARCDSISEEQEMNIARKGSSSLTNYDQAELTSEAHSRLAADNPVKTVAQSSSDTVSTTAEVSDNNRESSERNSPETPTPKKGLKKCLSSISEEEDLNAKSKDDLIGIILGLRRKTCCLNCNHKRNDGPTADPILPDHSKSEDSLDVILKSSCSTQTSAEKSTDRQSQDCSPQSVSNATRPPLTNEIDLLQTEVQQVYNVSTLFNHELASVQARLGNLIMKSENLSQGFQLLSTESQITLPPKNYEINPGGLHNLNAINTDC